MHVHMAMMLSMTLTYGIVLAFLKKGPFTVFILKLFTMCNKIVDIKIISGFLSPSTRYYVSELLARTFICACITIRYSFIIINLDEDSSHMISEFVKLFKVLQFGPDGISSCVDLKSCQVLIVGL